MIIEGLVCLWLTFVIIALVSVGETWALSLTPFAVWAGWVSYCVATSRRD